MAGSTSQPADVSGPGAPSRSRGLWRSARYTRWLRTTLWIAAPLALAATVLFVLLLALTPSARDAADRAAASVAEHSANAPATAIPERVSAAVVATEDHRFYQHPGIDPVALGRAAIGSLAGKDSGGSTIETQLAKLLYTGDRHDLSADLDMVGLAVKLDRTYSKDQVLLMYLNVAYFGHGLYGLQAASEGYFQTRPQSLDWDQAALLAGLLQAPTSYDPLVHPDAALERRHHVLDRLVATGKLTAADARALDMRGLELA
jgi:membrane peptidoglycan carboxypeptidase